MGKATCSDGDDALGEMKAAGRSALAPSGDTATLKEGPEDAGSECRSGLRPGEDSIAAPPRPRP